MIDYSKFNNLLSVILGKEVSIWDNNCIKDSNIELGIHLSSGGRLYKCFNIYEIIHKSKEWAKEKDYIISSYRPIVADDEGKQVFHYWYKAYIIKFDIGSYEPPNQVLNFDVNVLTELEGILLACQWILENIKND